MSDEDVRCAARELAERYSADVEDDSVSKLDHMKTIHAVNLGSVTLPPLDLLILNSLHALKIDTLFQISS